MKPNIIVVGPSGFGKSTSIENLDPETTVILNTERKALPFRRASLFKRQRFIDRLEDFGEQKGFDTLFEIALMDRDKNTKVIVIESFTSLSEIVLAKAKRTKVGFDVYGWYQSKITDIIQKSKSNPDIYVVFTAIDDLVKNDAELTLRSVKVEGKALEGKIEKEFVICLHTVIERDEKGNPKYQFLTNSDGIRTAKSPKGMLPRYMPNDLAEVIKLSEEYYKGE